MAAAVPVEDSLLEAAEKGDLVNVEGMLDWKPSLVNVRGGRLYKTALIEAAKNGHLAVVILLLDRGAKVDLPDTNHSTALFYACVGGHDAVASVLLKRGADASVKGAEGWTPLMAAAARGHLGIMRLLLSRADVAIDERRKDGCTALWCACRYKRAEAVKHLLLEGADHTVSGAGWSPRGVARIYNYRPVLAVLDWYEGELDRARLLSRARDIIDYAEVIKRAPERAGVSTIAEAHRARVEAAPAALRKRVEKGEALPTVDLSPLWAQWGDEVRRAAVAYVVKEMSRDVFNELLGLMGPAKKRGRAQAGQQGVVVVPPKGWVK